MGLSRMNEMRARNGEKRLSNFNTSFVAVKIHVTYIIAIDSGGGKF